MAQIKGVLVIAGVLLTAQHGAAQDRQATRIADMDRNRDGVITREEWRGAEREFELRDWNRDGLLSGDEWRADADQSGPGTVPRVGNRQSNSEFTDWTEAGFTSLDRNRDGRITSDEWAFEREAFTRADHNRDGIVTRAEFLNEDSPANARDAAFSPGARSRVEPPANLFSSVDTNGDGQITRAEWRWARRSFNQRDRNHDGRLTPDEFGDAAAPANASQAYQAGYQRGLAEGRQAGREDGQRNTWDLEGQRELETADSGYNAVVGARADYQAGYRDAFRRAYREGFEAR
jgi:Ca2+-binding EF-hand superfamily protein